MSAREGSLSKKELRRMMLGLRKGISFEALRALSRLAQKNLMRQEVWKQAKSVALYKPVRNEVDTEFLLDTAGLQCKTVYLPRIRPGEKGMMDFVLCRGPQEIVEGAFGIPEPDSCLPACVFSEPENCLAEDNRILAPPPDIFIVPGVAFDRAGQRLGFGGGYYDRFLSSALLQRHSYFIGLAYNFQVVEALPAEEWDQPVNALCTDVDYYEFKG